MGAGGHRPLLLQGPSLCVLRLSVPGQETGSSLYKAEALSAQARPIAGLPLDSPLKLRGPLLSDPTKLPGFPPATGQGHHPFSRLHQCLRSPSSLPLPLPPAPTAGLRTSHLASGMGRGPLPPTHGDLKLSIFLPGSSPSPTGRRRSPWPLITRVNSPPFLARASLGRGYYNENPLKDYLILQTHTPAARIQSK